MIIEIVSLATNAVALLAEGVDRNTDKEAAFLTKLMSPSSRRAWIEITMISRRDILRAVALLAEGVDRNDFDVMGG